ncbi:hypothetical protein HY990_02245 [Candidatus Micrarchaeota archaeon]|nr:hypothetical protein [Candidatus Micrarchaeota archaeon]
MAGAQIERRGREQEPEPDNLAMRMVPVKNVMAANYDRQTVQAVSVASAAYDQLTQSPAVRRAMSGSGLERIFG